jgi:hypothetical protein
MFFFFNFESRLILKLTPKFRILDFKLSPCVK